MTTIPADIQKIAYALVHDASRFDSVGDFLHDDMVRDIAAALMAERERCAKIADEAWRLDYKAEWIAAAIRKGTP